MTAHKAHPKGLRVRFQHPSMSDDGLGKYLGRSKGPWLDASGPVWKVRADLHLAAVAFDAPACDLGGYVLRLAAEDADALSSSLCVDGHDEEYRLNPDGTPARGDDGEVLPPLWRITSLCGSDVVDTGDAVDGLLSSQNLSLDAPQRRGWEVLDRLFAGQPTEVIRERTAAYVERYLATQGAVALAPSAATGTSSDEDSAAPARPNRDRAARVLGGWGRDGTGNRGRSLAFHAPRRNHQSRRADRPPRPPGRIDRDAQPAARHPYVEILDGCLYP